VSRLGELFSREIGYGDDLKLVCYTDEELEEVIAAIRQWWIKQKTLEAARIAQGLPPRKKHPKVAEIAERQRKAAAKAAEREAKAAAKAAKAAERTARKRDPRQLDLVEAIAATEATTQHSPLER